MGVLPNASKEVLKHLFGPKRCFSISLAPRLLRAEMPIPWPSMTTPGSQRSSCGRRSLVSRRSRNSSRKTLLCRGCGAGNRGDARCRIRARARARGRVWRGGHRCGEEQAEAVVARVMEEEEEVVSGDDC
eukprot:366030-Chlamydomonas_euryale.AAC.8